jgi:hypothetical protein
VESAEKRTDWIRFLYQKSLPRMDKFIVDVVRHLVFISSIFVGFLFTVVSDLVLSHPNTNDLLIIIIFSCLIISSFSLFACIILGAIFQYLFNMLIVEANDTSPDSPKSEQKIKLESDSDFDEFIGGSMPLVKFLIGGLAFIGIAFLIGIFFFILSFIFIGWIRSFVFVFIASILFIGLGLTAIYSGSKIVSLYNAAKTARPSK